MTLRELLDKQPEHTVIDNGNESARIIRYWEVVPESDLDKTVVAWGDKKQITVWFNEAQDGPDYIIRNLD